jgi:quercetin dioxygenase-like cupin family protein
VVANSFSSLSVSPKLNEKEVAMNVVLLMALAALTIGACSAAPLLTEQKPETRRTDLQRYDLGVSEREVVQVRVDFDPGYVGFKHRHSGEEVIYVIEGTMVYHVEGRPAATYTAGDVLTVPFGAVHWVENVGSDNGAELATYIVEKGKPLLELTE